MIFFNSFISSMCPQMFDLIYRWNAVFLAKFNAEENNLKFPSFHIFSFFDLSKADWKQAVWNNCLWFLITLSTRPLFNQANLSKWEPAEKRKINSTRKFVNFWIGTQNEMNHNKSSKSFQILFKVWQTLNKPLCFGWGLFARTMGSRHLHVLPNCEWCIWAQDIGVYKYNSRFSNGAQPAAACALQSWNLRPCTCHLKYKI